MGRLAGRSRCGGRQPHPGLTDLSACRAGVVAASRATGSLDSKGEVDRRRANSGRGSPIQTGRTAVGRRSPKGHTASLIQRGESSEVVRASPRNACGASLSGLGQANAPYRRVERVRIRRAEHPGLSAALNQACGSAQADITRAAGRRRSRAPASAPAGTPERGLPVWSDLGVGRRRRRRSHVRG